MERKQMSIGVDLHKGQFTTYWKSGDGEKDSWKQYKTTTTGYKQFLQEINDAWKSGYRCEVAVESSGNTRYFKRKVEEVGATVKVINTLKFKVVNESVKKTDHRDAATIAEFLEKDMLPEAKLCSPESEELRRLLKVRENLVRTTVQVKNQLHGMLMSMGIELDKSSLQSKKNRQAAKDVLIEHGQPGETVDPFIETIDQLEKRINSINRIIEEKTKDDWMVQLLRTIPGAGLINAATVKAYTDDINRFRTYKQYSAYAGLAPYVQKSNESEYIGNITKRGPEELRTALVQIVLGMARSKKKTAEYRMMKRYEDMKTQKGSGKSIIATARKLSKIIWHMLHNNTPFDPRKMKDPILVKHSVDMQVEASRIAS